MATTKNHDLKNLDNIASRYSDEIANANSAQSNGWDEHDLRRAKEYMVELRSVAEHANSRPRQDLPGSTPQREFTFDEIKNYENVTNEHTNHTLVLLTTMRHEWRVSQSVPRGNGFHHWDFVRTKQYFDNIDSYISEVIEPLEQLMDYPDTGTAGANSTNHPT